ncbi:YcxB family protein [Flavobacterium phragmitis]|nr:YcxB family protein [Flavobacterium phragmitis]
MRLDKFPNRYKLTFTYSDICVKSPLGELTHKWSKIEKVILTKNFLFFYIKERNGYIISISKKDSDYRKIEELLSFVEKNVIPVIKV